MTGTAEDGVIEGYELEGRPEVLAVQWHPEMLAEQPDPAFAWLVEQARTFASAGLQVDGFDGSQDRT